MEQIKKLILGLKALELQRIGDQTMGGVVTLEAPLEAGVEYAVIFDGIRHDIKCEEKDGKLRLAYEPPKHGGIHEPFEIMADGVTAYVTCRSVNPDVSIAIMEEVEPNAGGGGEPIIITAGEDGSATCNKTYEECMVDYENKQWSAYLYDGNFGFFFPVSALSTTEDGITSLLLAFALPEALGGELSIFTVGPDGVTKQG